MMEETKDQRFLSALSALTLINLLQLWIWRSVVVIAAMPGYWFWICAFLIPFSVLTAFKSSFEAVDRPWLGTAFLPAFRAAVKSGSFTNKSLSTLLALGGASYYLYNEVAFLALGKVNPVTHAVGNTIKRVVIIVASVVAFKTPMSTGSIVGSSIAILGTLLYSLAMNSVKK